MNVFRWEAGKDLTDTKAINYLRRSLPLFPESVLKDAFAKRDVKMDGVRIGPDASVPPGARMEVYTPFGPELDVVYEDERVLLINKPAGLCVRDEHCPMTVETLAAARCGDGSVPRLCHRLDTRTSGLLLLAKDGETEEQLAAMFKGRDIAKEYECLVKGEMRPPEALCEAFLIKDAQRGRVRVISHRTPGAKEIRTAYAVLSREGELSRLRVKLLTGRTHQIRAHMAYLGHPILGDDIYGDRGLNRRMGAAGSLKLCAVSLTLHPSRDSALYYLDGREFTVAAPF